MKDMNKTKPVNKSPRSSSAVTSDGTDLAIAFAVRD